MSRNDWQQHPEDFLVVYKTGVNMDGNRVTSYLVMEYTPFRSLSYTLDGGYEWVEEMIEAGVAVVSVDEFNEKVLMKIENFRTYQQT